VRRNEIFQKEERNKADKIKFFFFEKRSGVSENSYFSDGFLGTSIGSQFLFSSSNKKECGTVLEK